MFGLTKQEKFWKAISADSAEDFKNLFEKKFLTLKMKDDISPFIYIVRQGSLNCIKELIKLGIDKNFKNDYGQTLLIRAAMENKIDIAKYLLEIGADIEVSDQSGKDALFWSIEEKNFAFVSLMLANGCNINKQYNGITPLILMVDQQNSDAVKYLLKNKADTEKQTKSVQTAIFYAVYLRNGNIDIVKNLLENSANINKQDKNGDTPLMLAAQNNFVDIVKLLIKKGANINSKSKDGQTAILLAQAKGHSQVINVLEKAGAKKVDPTEKLINDSLKEVFGKDFNLF